MSGWGSAPSSSGNLGPGFDSIALALELRCEVVAEPADAWVLEEQGTVTTGREDDLVVRAVRMAVDRPMRLRIDNQIPRSRGLGSSSAVTTAAAVAAFRALELPVDTDRLFDIVTELEGHADNAAAAVFGGLVLTDSGGTWRHMEMSPDLRVLAAVPEYHLSTQKARSALPDVISHRAAARNIARVGFLIEGLRTGDADALAAASGDEMHELPRHPLSPLTDQLMRCARDAGALHASWSGAGPSALAFCTVETIEPVSKAFEALLAGAGTVMELVMATDGFH